MIECPGCGARRDPVELTWPIPDLEEKVLPGEIMPLGECPDCDELIYDADFARRMEGFDDDQ